MLRVFIGTLNTSLEPNFVGVLIGRIVRPRPAPSGT